LRGYGATTSPRAVSAYKTTTLVADVLALIAASGARETLLVAHDWGAILAWQIAMDHPDRIARMIIMNVPHPARFRAEFWRTGQFLRSWYMFFFQLPALPEWLLGRAGAQAVVDAFRTGVKNPERFSDTDIEIYRRNALRRGGLTAMINWYRAWFRYGDRSRRNFPMIETPTLLIWGDGDMALGVQTALGTEAHVRDLTFRRLAGVSHWVQQEAPEQVNAMMEAWLTHLPVPEYRS